MRAADKGGRRHRSTTHLDMPTSKSHAVGMSSETGRQYTIRGVPVRVDRALRERSRREGRSLNQLALEALRRFVDVPEEPAAHEDLDDLVGSWIEDPDIDAALEDQRGIDEDLWR